VFDDGGPSRGLGKVVGGSVRLLSKATSKGKEEKDDWVSEGVTPTGPRRQVLGPMTSTSESSDNSAPKNEPEGNVDVVSAAGEGTGGDVEGWSSNNVCTFRMRSSNTRPSKEISLKKLEQVGETYLDVNTISPDIIPGKDSIIEPSSELLHSHGVLI
jgi:hypothetical protein